MPKVVAKEPNIKRISKPAFFIEDILISKRLRLALHT